MCVGLCVGGVRRGTPAPGIPRPPAPSASSLSLSSYSSSCFIRCERRVRAGLGAALGLGGFGEEFENRREALPGSELGGGRCLKKRRQGEGVGGLRGGLARRRRGRRGGARDTGPPIVGPGGRGLPGRPPPPSAACDPLGPTPEDHPLYLRAHMPRPGGARQADSAAPGPAARDSAVAGRRPHSVPPPPPRPMRGRGPLVSPAVARGAASAPCGPIEARGGERSHSLSRRGKPPTAPRLGARGDWSPRRGSAASRPLPHPPPEHSRFFASREKETSEFSVPAVFTFFLLLLLFFF